MNDLAEHVGCTVAKAQLAMVHEHVQLREEVKLALDVFLRRMRIEEVRHDLEDLLNDTILRVSEAFLKLVNAVIFDKEVHERFMATFKRIARLNDAVDDCFVLRLCIVFDLFEHLYYILDYLFGGNNSEGIGSSALLTNHKQNNN